MPLFLSGDVMPLFILLLLFPFFSFAKSFTPFKLTPADEVCLAKPVLYGLTLSGAFRHENSWLAILHGCIYEARGVVVGTSGGTVVGDWYPVAADESPEGGGGSGDASGVYPASFLLDTADSLRRKECDNNPLLICGSFDGYYAPRETMPLSQVRYHSQYYVCHSNATDWRNLYNSSCYLLTGYKIQNGQIIPDNDNDNGNDNSGGNSGGNDNSGGDSSGDSGNEGDETGDQWAKKIYNLLNSGIPAIGEKIDEFHYSFLNHSSTSNNYLSGIDEKLGELTEKDNSYNESQQQFNSTIQGIIEGGIQTYEQGVKDKVGDLISQIENYVPVLNVTHVLPVGFFGNNKDTCMPLNFNFTLSPFGGSDIPVLLSTKELCRYYDGYLRELVRFFIYVLTGIALIVLVDKSISRL